MKQRSAKPFPWSYSSHRWPRDPGPRPCGPPFFGANTEGIISERRGASGVGGTRRRARVAMCGHSRTVLRLLTVSTLGAVGGEEARGQGGPSFSS